MDDDGPRRLYGESMAAAGSCRACGVELREGARFCDRCGAPAALEDHAFRACLAALGIQHAAEALAAEVMRRDGVTLRLRIGINSGQVIAGEIGSSPGSYTADGDQVGMAQRMDPSLRQAA